MFGLHMPQDNAHETVLMSQISFDLVGFDVDGTLLDTSGDLADAVSHAIADIGLAPYSAAQIRPFVGRGARVMLRRALAAQGKAEPELTELTNRLKPRLMDYYADHLAVHTRPFPGAVEMLDTLRARGVPLAVCTNKVERLARPLLDQLGLSGYFRSIVCGDTVGVLKPDPAPVRAMIERTGLGTAESLRCLFVGDTTNDTGAAKAAGLPCVAVSFGFCDMPPAELGAARVIDRYEELPPLVENWPG